MDLQQGRPWVLLRLWDKRGNGSEMLVGMCQELTHLKDNTVLFSLLHGINHEFCVSKAFTVSSVITLHGCSFERSIEGSRG